MGGTGAAALIDRTPRQISRDAEFLFLTSALFRRVELPGVKMLQVRRGRVFWLLWISVWRQFY